MKKNQLRFIALLLYCVVSAVILFGCNTANETPANINQTEQTQQTQESSTDAISEALGGLDMDVEATRANYEKLANELEALHRQNPKDEATAFNYAEKLYQLGNFTQSKEVLKPLLANAPSSQAIYLSAQIEYVFGNYSEAERLYETLMNEYPEYKAIAESELELVYYQTKQYQKSHALSEENISEMGEMMRAFGDREPYQLEWNESDETIIPFIKTDPLPLVQLEINGEFHNFIIDTGAGDTLLDGSLASSLGIKAISSFEGTFAGGETAMVGYGILDTIKLNGVTIHSLPVNMLPSETFEGFASSFYHNEFKISGMIGVGIFSQFLATMDYPTGQLVLSSKDKQYARGENTVEIPFIMAWTHFIISKCEINGKEVNVFHDSGLAADAKILLPDETLFYTGIEIIATENIEGLGGAGVTEIQIGHFNVDTFKISALSEKKNIRGLSGIFPATFYNSEGFFIDSLISHNYYKNYIWTIDFDSMKMTFS